MTDTLSTLSDAELSECFAVEVAGWSWWTGYFAGENEDGEWRFLSKDGRYSEGWRTGKPARPDQMGLKVFGGDEQMPSFATDANAVLLWLEKCNTYDVDYMSAEIDDDPHHYRIRVDTIPADAPTFPRAACIALIRAKRAEKQE